jgi:hypothetical protein
MTPRPLSAPFKFSCLACDGEFEDDALAFPNDFGSQESEGELAPIREVSIAFAGSIRNDVSTIAFKALRSPTVGDPPNRIPHPRIYPVQKPFRTSAPNVAEGERDDQ